MRLLYGESDEKYVQIEETVEKQYKIEYYYKDRPFVPRTDSDFDRNALPIVFKVSPESLLNLAAAVVDKLPLPSIYEWTNEDVCRWIREYGYHHYQNTFRVNFITGRKLLLIDAQALSAMNIKNFHDIKHIAYGIRQLFHFEMTKFMRSISLPPQYYYELYKLFRTKSGLSFGKIKRSELWRRMQLIRKRKPYLSHWETLERWLERKCDPEDPEIIGGIPHYHLYRCKKIMEQFTPTSRKSSIKCSCIPPCTCNTTKLHIRAPKVFSILKSTRKPDYDEYYQKHCHKCMPPCTCHWAARNFRVDTLLSCLRIQLPLKYGNRVQLEQSFSQAMSGNASVYSIHKSRVALFN